jgi:hypothetical protein
MGKLTAFDPPNSFRWEAIDFHGKPALHVKRKNGVTDCVYIIGHEIGPEDIERIRLACVEMDENAGLNGVNV